LVQHQREIDAHLLIWRRRIEHTFGQMGHHLLNSVNSFFQQQKRRQTNGEASVGDFEDVSPRIVEIKDDKKKN